VYELYHRAYELIPTDSAARKHVYSFDQTWVTHLYQKVTFFQEEARQRESSILPESEQPDVFSSVISCALDHDAECVTEILVKGICRRLILKPQQIYVDLILSEYNPFKILKDGKLKSEPLNLYESLRSYFVLKYSENVAKRVEGLFEKLHKLRNEMLCDDLSLPFRRDCLIRYFRCLCMIEPFFPLNASPNPPIFVWYNAINPQQDSSQPNIHLEKASVLFNLAALCTHIAVSCDLTTIHGHRLAMDALNDALHWLSLLRFESYNKACGTIDLSEQYTRMIKNGIASLKLKFPHPQS
ncbi:hypothetical protein S83_053520, partial [Arachis hypogaea]